MLLRAETSAWTSSSDHISACVVAVWLPLLKTAFRSLFKFNGIYREHILFHSDSSNFAAAKTADACFAGSEIICTVRKLERSISTQSTVYITSPTLWFCPLCKKIKSFFKRSKLNDCATARIYEKSISIEELSLPSKSSVATINWTKEKVINWDIISPAKILPLPPHL